MILDCKGALHSFGLPEYGQLGKYAGLAGAGFPHTVGTMDPKSLICGKNCTQNYLIICF
jgi:hypothetical protein